MTLDEFRHEMNEYRRDAKKDADAFKDPVLVFERMQALYRKFDAAERRMADQVIAEWLSSANEALRFEACILTTELNIVSAVPALKELAKRLPSMREPGAPSELKAVHRAITELKEGHRSDEAEG